MWGDRALIVTLSYNLPKEYPPRASTTVRRLSDRSSVRSPGRLAGVVSVRAMCYDGFSEKDTNREE